jgi:AcrR family transcriptional regulator
MSGGDRIPLTRERIIAGALDYVDQHGLEALSMRKLGAALGVEAMSLYNHVENKDDVLDGILDMVLRTVAVPARDRLWEDRLRVLVGNFRATGIEHPGVLSMFGNRPIRTPEGFAPIAAFYEILLDAGLPEECALDAFLSVSSFVLGLVIIEAGRIQIEKTRSVTNFFGSWDAQEHKIETDLGAALVNDDWGREFDRVVDLLLDGVRALVERDGTA